jgi:biofilm PGA synthesis N-glycosyltransferase PgaC
MNTEETRTTQPLVLSHYDVEAWRREQRAHGKPPWETAAFPALTEPAPPKPTIVALLPAYNEADAILGTINALRMQDRLPDRIIVIPNNCTDNTEAIAQNAGVEVMTMHDNPYLKAGALNFALDKLLLELNDDDLILIQDADTQLNPEFISAAEAAVAPDIGGICARYDNPAPRNLLERLQSSEFARSRRLTSRRHGTTKILVGIASLFRVGTLRAVKEARINGILPGSPTVYNNTSLCEDYELTIALKTLGYRLTCPPECRPLTHAMPTFSKLWNQRVRWTRGALDDLHVYGITRVTRSYILAQVGRMLAMLSPLLYLSYLLSLQLTYGHITWSIPWVLVNVVFIVERVVTVREEGPKAMLLAALLFPELVYDWFLAVTYLTGLTKHLRGSVAQWKET